MHLCHQLYILYFEKMNISTTSSTYINNAIVPRRIIVLTYRSHTADYYRYIPFHVYLNVLSFAARFFQFILTIPALIRIVFHVTKKEKEQPLPQFVLSLISCVCRKQCREQDLCPNDSGPLLIAVTSTLL